MSNILSVKDHLGKQYNCKRASAINVRDLLLLVGARLTASKQHVEKQGLPAGTLADSGYISAMLMSMPNADFARVEELVGVKGITPHGQETQVDLDYFRTNMIGYFHVVAGLVRENLQDFFTWLSSDQNDETTE